METKDGFRITGWGVEWVKRKGIIVQIEVVEYYHTVKGYVCFNSGGQMWECGYSHFTKYESGVEYRARIKREEAEQADLRAFGYDK